MRFLDTNIIIRAITRDDPVKGQALVLYYQYTRLDFEDALSLAVMRHDTIGAILSYDTDFDGLSGIIREEP